MDANISDKEFYRILGVELPVLHRRFMEWDESMAAGKFELEFRDNADRKLT